MHVTANWQALCYSGKRDQQVPLSLLPLITGAPPQKDDSGRGDGQGRQG